MDWINALRPACGIITSLLVISGFNLVNEPVNWFIVAAVFFITSASMLWNDFYDKELDLGKNKTLAIKYPNRFVAYSLFFTIISYVLSIFVIYYDLLSGILCFSLLLIAIIYSYIQNIPIIKTMAISLTTGSMFLFPMFKSGNNLSLWILIAIIVAVISIREYLKDVEDMEVDRGKKQTLALIVDSKISQEKVKFWKSIMSLSVMVVIVAGFLL